MLKADLIDFSGSHAELLRTCGTPLIYESEGFADEVQINIGSLDEPEDLVPQAHVFVAEKLPWLRLDDGLPRYAATSRDGAPID